MQILLEILTIIFVAMGAGTLIGITIFTAKYIYGKLAYHFISDRTIRISDSYGERSIKVTGKRMTEFYDECMKHEIKGGE